MGAGVGRNERCPCGSGKKYKSCCLGVQSDLDVGQGEVIDALERLERAGLVEARVNTPDGPLPLGRVPESERGLDLDLSIELLEGAAADEIHPVPCPSSLRWDDGEAPNDPEYEVLTVVMGAYAALASQASERGTHAFAPDLDNLAGQILDVAGVGPLPRALAVPYAMQAVARLQEIGVVEVSADSGTVEVVMRSIPEIPMAQRRGIIDGTAWV